MTRLFWLLPLLLLASGFLTGALRGYALKRNLMDVPNARSSHEVPTPRGGGLAIVLVFAVGLLLMAGELPSGMVAGLLGAGGAVALLGWLDDHSHISARWRFLGHVATAIWMLYWLGGMPDLQFAGVPEMPVWLWQVLGVLFLVWLLNLYNFMDGIDGLAGLQAVTVCVAGACLAWYAGAGGLVTASMLLAAACLGFLPWNWPPARIFMGDVGSGAVGMLIGGISVSAANLSEGLFWGWLILLGVFIVDATVTLLQRMIRGERVYEAHRSHAYQAASRQFGGHRSVTVAVGLINLFWLFPWGFLVVASWIPGLLGLLVAYMPLVVIAVYFNAGNRKAQERRQQRVN